MSYICGSGYHNTVVVGPGRLIGVVTRGICGDTRSIVDLTITRENRTLRHPVECLLRPSGIGIVLGVHGQSRAKMEKSSVGSSIFVRPPIEPRIDLPAHATTANAIGNLLLVATYELIEDRLCHGEPTGLIGGRVLEFVLGCSNHGEGPEDLVVVSFVLRLVRGHLQGLAKDLQR